MNVLFVFDKPLDAEAGGVERVTSTIMSGLAAQYNYTCEYAYDTGKAVFVDGVERVDVERFLIDENYDVIVQQIAYSSVISQTIKNKKLKIPFIVAWHTAPPTLKKCWYVATTKVWGGKSKKIKRLIRIALFPCFYYKEKKRFMNRWAPILPITSKILLLSKSFRKDFEMLLKLPAEKFYAIPNPVSFPQVCDESILDCKEKRVLIVARMQELAKRISLALMIWKKIEMMPECKDWFLDLVGNGNDIAMYKAMVKKLQLQRVKFYGQQNPIPFYKRSSIYMMTSCFEGWGLSMTEAAQYGMPTVAFDSYASIKDIIINNENGFLVPFADVETYAKKLSSLMLDDDKRKEMSLNSIRFVERFTLQRILPIWKEFLSQFQLFCK